MKRGLLAGLAVLGLVALTAPPSVARTALPGAGCPMFPADSWWHSDISALPVDPRSDAYVASMGAGTGLHPDFGAGQWDGGPIGIPFAVVDSSVPAATVSFDYDDESDHGAYRIPAGVPIEGGPQSDGDRHVLLVDRDACTLAELYDARPNGDGSWHAGSGAIWDLGDDALRPDGWTSADAAGLPILPGLVRRDEVAAGHVDHAIRVTARRTADAHVWPARHDAGATDGAPPMGLRLRLKASVDVSGYPRDVQVILQAAKTYGLVVADNGSSWFLSGVPDPGWDDDVLHVIGGVHGSDFEAVDESALMADPNSGRVSGAAAPGPSPVDGAGATTAPGAGGAPPRGDDPSGPSLPTAPAAAPAGDSGPSTTTTSAPVSPTSSTSTTARHAGTEAAATIDRPAPPRGPSWWPVGIAAATIAGVSFAAAKARSARRRPG